jgi:5,10-methylenetetrahydrofolate reductase
VVALPMRLTVNEKNKLLTEDGIAYATEQIIDLLSFGVDRIHLYTMNRSDLARKIINDTSNIRDCFTETPALI